MNSEKVLFSFFMILALTLNFGFFIGERIRVHVADSSHPITAGIDDWGIYFKIGEAF